MPDSGVPDPGAQRTRYRRSDPALNLSAQVAAGTDRDGFLRSPLVLLEAVRPSENTTWNAVDVVSGETEIVGSSAPPEWGSAVTDLLVQVAEDRSMITSYLSPASIRPMRHAG